MIASPITIAQNFSYAPPASCPGPWAKVILEADFSITAGIQYDRTANIWIGPTNIYFGTTAEDDPTNGPPLAGSARSHRLQLDFHHVADRHRRPRQHRQQHLHRRSLRHRDLVFLSASRPAKQRPSSPTRSSVFRRPNGGTVGLGSSTSLLEQTLTLPTNIQNAFTSTSSPEPVQRRILV